MKKAIILFLAFVSLTLGCNASTKKAEDVADSAGKAPVAVENNEGKTTDAAEKTEPVPADKPAVSQTIPSAKFVEPNGFDVVIQGKTVKGKIISTFHADEDPNMDKKYIEKCKSLDDGENAFCSFIAFDDESIPEYYMTNTRNLPVMNLGDLDGDGSDELAVQPEFRAFVMGEKRRVYITISLKKADEKSEWVELLPCLDTDIRVPLYLPAEKVADKAGWVTVRYVDVPEGLEELAPDDGAKEPEHKLITKELEISNAKASDIKSKVY